MSQNIAEIPLLPKKRQPGGALFDKKCKKKSKKFFNVLKLLGHEVCVLNAHDHESHFWKSWTREKFASCFDQVKTCD